MATRKKKPDETPGDEVKDVTGENEEELFPFPRIKTTSGITVEVKPFPAGLWTKLIDRALREYPDATPPMKTVEVVDGTEETEDLQDAGYLAAQAAAQDARQTIVGNAVLKYCVFFVDDSWEEWVPMLEEDRGEPYPENATERRIQFMEEFVFRSKEEFSLVGELAMAQMLIDDEEVMARVRSFRS